MALVLLLPQAVFADQWISYLGGGVDRVSEGDWRVRSGQVLFRNVNGTLVSVPARDVDLATSTFMTWQLNGRRGSPPRLSLPATGSAVGESAECEPAKVAALLGSETLEVVTAGKPEVVHVACLDSPETQHRLTQVAWFGRAALSWLEFVVRAGDEVCVTPESPPQVDGEGHRIVYLTLPDGSDYAGRAIGAGFGILRADTCARAGEYRRLEDRAITEQRGLWGAKAERAAIAAVSHAGGEASGPPPRRRSSGGG